MLLESVVVSECGLLRITERSRDRISNDVGDRGLRVGDQLAVLNVEAPDLCEWVANELGDDSEHLAGVDGHAAAVESRITHAVRIEVASIRIASASIASGRVCTSAGVASAHGLCDGVARVGCYGCRDCVRFPNVHLGAARAMVSNSSILVVGRWHPAFDIALRKGLVS